jgi:hypothetical protein
MIGIGAKAMGFAVGDTNRTQLQIPHRHRGMYSQRGRTPVHGKVLRRNIRVEGNSGQTNTTGFLLKKARTIRHHLRKGKG